MGLSCLSKWRMMLLASLIQTVGQIPGLVLYPVTSNGGEIALLMGMTYFLLLAQEDIILTARFADFLHQSNAVFRRAGNRNNVTGVANVSMEVPGDEAAQGEQGNLNGESALPNFQDIYGQSNEVELRVMEL
jgi:hypothetical protein